MINLFNFFALAMRSFGAWTAKILTCFVLLTQIRVEASHSEMKIFSRKDLPWTKLLQRQKRQTSSEMVSRNGNGKLQVAVSNACLYSVRRIVVLFDQYHYSVA